MRRLWRSEAVDDVTTNMWRKKVTYDTTIHNIDERTDVLLEYLLLSGRLIITRSQPEVGTWSARFDSEMPSNGSWTARKTTVTGSLGDNLTHGKLKTWERSRGLGTLICEGPSGVCVICMPSSSSSFSSRGRTRAAILILCEVMWNSMNRQRQQEVRYTSKQARRFTRGFEKASENVMTAVLIRDLSVEKWPLAKTVQWILSAMSVERRLDWGCQRGGLSLPPTSTRPVTWSYHHNALVDKAGNSISGYKTIKICCGKYCSSSKSDKRVLRKLVLIDLPAGMLQGCTTDTRLIFQL